MSDRGQRYDYVSPGLFRVHIDHHLPHLAVGDPSASSWEYLRREIPHTWYVDERYPRCGFLSRDEAMLLHNSARQFRGRRALEIGCWKGWSTGHLLAAGVRLDVIDPILARPEFLSDVEAVVAGVCGDHPGTPPALLVAGASPAAVEQLAAQRGQGWSFFFVDGEHARPSPLDDAVACHAHATKDALVFFHDLTSPEVAEGLDYLAAQGWETMLYQTMQIMGVAWRGTATPVPHQPDPNVAWRLPEHLTGYALSPRS